MQLECQVRLRSFKGGPKPETGLPSTQSQGTLYSKRRKAIKRASGSNINMFQESSLSRLLIYLKATFYILNNLQTRRWRRKFENEHRLCMTAGVLLIWKHLKLGGGFWRFEQTKKFINFPSKMPQRRLNELCMFSLNKYADYKFMTEFKNYIKLKDTTLVGSHYLFNNIVS